MNEKADWGNEMKGTALLNPIELKHWIIVCSQQKANAANLFISTYGDVIRSMGIKAERPERYFYSSMPKDVFILLKETQISKRSYSKR